MSDPTPQDRADYLVRKLEQFIRGFRPGDPGHDRDGNNELGDILDPRHRTGHRRE